MRKLKKSFYEQRQELRDSLYRLEGAIGRYKKNSETAELGSIAMELRGLLLGEALLLGIANQKGFSLEMYRIPSIDMSDLHNPTVFFEADCVNLKCEKPWTERVTVEDWLTMPVALVKGSMYTPTRLISEIANTIGPAHYSREISDALSQMKRISLGGVPSHFRTLLRFGEVLLVLGQRFLSTY